MRERPKDLEHSHVDERLYFARALSDYARRDLAAEADEECSQSDDTRPPFANDGVLLNKLPRGLEIFELHLVGLRLAIALVRLLCRLGFARAGFADRHHLARDRVDLLGVVLPVGAGNIEAAIFVFFDRRSRDDRLHCFPFFSSFFRRCRIV